eukprot:766612-Hanusia_phi.AAC.3
METCENRKYLLSHRQGVRRSDSRRQTLDGFQGDTLLMTIVSAGKQVNSYGFGGGQPHGAWHYWELPEETSRSSQRNPAMFYGLR